MATSVSNRPVEGSSPDLRRPDLAAAAPMALVVILLTVALWQDGAIATSNFTPLAVVAASALAVIGIRAAGKPLATAFAAGLWAYALWVLASGLWSDAPGGAVEHGARELFYATLATLPAVSLRTRASALVMGRGLIAVLGVVVAGTTVLTLFSGPDNFVAGRLEQPIGYRNGMAALMGAAAVALIGIAAPRGERPLLRAAAFASAVAAIGLGYSTQSRGVVVGFAAGVALAVALGPDRLRRIFLTVAAAALVVAVHGDLLAPYHAFLETRTTPDAAVDTAMTALLLATAVGFLGMLGAAVLDRGLRIGETARARLRWAGVAVLVVGALGTAALAVRHVGDPVQFARDKVDEFRSLEVTAPGESRLGSVSGQRYDLWRIAGDQFADSPLIGEGGGAYPGRYYLERATDRNLNNPHSLPLRVLAETGLIGGLLLGGALLAGTLAVLRRWRDLPDDTRRITSLLFAAAGVVLVQSLVDWLWLIPALGGLTILCFGTAVALAESGVGPERRPRRITRVAVRVAPAVAAVLCSALFLSAIYVRDARSHQEGSAEQQLRSARTAERFDPVALAPRLLQASALERLGRVDEAYRELQGALEVEPSNHVLLALIGDLEYRRNRFAEARAWYERALARNPRDVGLRELARTTTP